ncbi:hypothetical protein CERZMDRAFT_96093 [Cercospora zeae-maydis SCOH1-5]|uniref:Uncharacterized protein n=1 Tax=Cercospora zeae-maydis SCOH1-5 TaxID=717836 RepID=A0A6A6FLJ5_9PEZI|nr:hypothetical protein CERZMDRAFT_96093 [Cercospora zeae-maydis SCOH1-5]
MAEPTYEELKEKLRAAQVKVDTAEHKAEMAKEKAETAEKELATVLGHLKVAYRVLRMHHGIPADIFSEQLQGFSQRESGEPGEFFFFEEYYGCFGDLPPNGVDLAIKQIIECAEGEIDGRNPGPPSLKELPFYDSVTLAAACRKMMTDHADAMADLYDPRCDIDKIVRPLKASTGRRDASEHASVARTAEAALKKVSFPLTLNLLHQVQRKKIAEFLVPMIAGDTLPVELMAMVCSCCYGADFVARAPAIAQENAPKRSSRR